jgi:hypothetical protein
MVRVLDWSDKTTKDYCSSFDILKGIKDINIVWEEMSMNCWGVMLTSPRMYAQLYRIIEPLENIETLVGWCKRWDWTRLHLKM